MAKRVLMFFVAVVVLSGTILAQVDGYKSRLEKALWNLDNIDPDYISEQLTEAEILLDSDDWLDTQKGKAILENLEPLFVDTRIAETRCIWVDYVTFGNFFTRGDIARLLDQFADIGIHILFPEVYAYGTTIYPSEVAKIQDQYLYLWEDGDILEVFIEEAHSRGMEVHPLVRVFSSGYKTPGYLINQHPEWLEVTRDGTRGTSNSWFISPVIPEFRRFLEAVMTELVTNYDIDGLHLDYIRYEEGDFGYSSHSRDLYKKLFFRDPIEFVLGSADDEAYKDFRRAHVDAFVRWCYQNLKEIKPDLLISAAVGSPHSWGYKSLFQDWVFWSTNGYIDFVTPMQYRDTTPKLQTAIREDKSANAASVPLFSGLGLYLFINSATELESQIAEVQKQNLPGVALFSEANLSVYSYTRIKNGIFREKAVPVHRDPEYAIKVYIDDLCERILKNGRYLGLEEEVLQSYVEQIQESGGSVGVALGKYPRLEQSINTRLEYVKELHKYYKIDY